MSKKTELSKVKDWLKMNKIPYIDDCMFGDYYLFQTELYEITISLNTKNIRFYITDKKEVEKIKIIQSGFVKFFWFKFKTYKKEIEKDFEYCNPRELTTPINIKNIETIINYFKLIT